MTYFSTILTFDFASFCLDTLILARGWQGNLTGISRLLGKNGLSKKIGFGTSGRFLDFGCFFEKHVFPESGPEGSGRCLGPSPTYSGLFRPILDLFWTIFDQNRLNN
jgi:hypothetical protein